MAAGRDLHGLAKCKRTAADRLSLLAFEPRRWWEVWLSAAGGSAESAKGCGSAATHSAGWKSSRRRAWFAAYTHGGRENVNRGYSGVARRLCRQS